MRRIFFRAAALAALLSSASAEEDGPAPDASERKWALELRMIAGDSYDD